MYISSNGMSATHNVPLFILYFKNTFSFVIVVFQFFSLIYLHFYFPIIFIFLYLLYLILYFIIFFLATLVSFYILRVSSFLKPNEFSKLICVSKRRLLFIFFGYGLKFMSPLPMASWDLWASMQPAILKGALNTSGGFVGGGDGVECTKCGRHYKLKSSLRNHQKWECGKEPQFQCPYCNYRAKQKMHVARHIERMHREKLDMLEMSERASLTGGKEEKEVAQ